MKTLIFTSILGGGMISPKDAIKFAKENNFDSICQIDNKFTGLLDFYSQAKKENILPIIALKTIVEGLKIIIVLKNESAYRKLIKLTSLEVSGTNIKISDINDSNFLTFIEGFESDIDDLEEKIASIDANIMAGPSQDTDRYIQSRKLYELKGTKKMFSTFIPTILKVSDYRAEVLLNSILSEETYLNSDNKAIEDYMALEDFLDHHNTIAKAIAEANIVDDFNFGHPTAPEFIFTSEEAVKLGLPKETTDSELFEYLSKKGLEERLSEMNLTSSEVEVYKDRLDKEINIINTMGFPGYMLIVADFVSAARNMGVSVGPGRGSAAGSLVAYSLKITDIDPIPYGLLFERFLNPERVSMPDIDMDFSDRKPVIEYVEKKYGQERVAQIMTVSSLGGRSAFKAAGKYLGMPLHTVNQYVKLIPDTPGTTLSSAMKDNEKEIENALLDPAFKRVWKGANSLDGQLRTFGIHAAGVIISDKPVYEKAPIIKVGKEVAIAYQGKETEDHDLIKFDFLGLNTLQIIKEALDLIKRNHNIQLDMNKIDYADKEVYDMLSTGNTSGVFQLDSEGMQSLNKRLKPSKFEDIISILALYRPGPMESGMLENFVKRKNGEKEIEYFFKDFEPILKPILENTYGVIVYQEQVMQIVREIGGFSLGESDIIRRAMGKKDVHYMNIKKSEFADGAVKKGLKKEEAIELFELIIKFAGYGFNKSHSAAYGMVSFQTAFLKCHYPAEYYCALMNNQKTTEKVGQYIKVAKKDGVNILNPDINTMTENFDTIDGKTISFGMSKIKGVGSTAKKFLKELKENGEIKDFDTLCARHPKLSKKILSALVYSGAIDSFDLSRNFMLKGEDTEMSTFEKLETELDYTGIHVTDPFEKARSFIDPYVLPELNTLENYEETVLLAFQNNFIELTAKKSGKKFAIIDLIFNGEVIKVAAFDELFEQLKGLNMNRPHIFTVKRNDENYSISLIEDFTPSNLEKRFFKK